MFWKKKNHQMQYGMSEVKHEEGGYVPLPMPKPPAPPGPINIQSSYSASEAIRRYAAMQNQARQAYIQAAMNAGIHEAYQGHVVTATSEALLTEYGFTTRKKR